MYTGHWYDYYECFMLSIPFIPFKLYKTLYSILCTITCQRHHQSNGRVRGREISFCREGVEKMGLECLLWLIILKGRKELMNPQSLWSAVLFVREERLRLECESRVSVSKWELGRVGRLKISTLRYTCMNVFTLARNQVFWIITCQTV